MSSGLSHIFAMAGRHSSKDQKAWQGTGRGGVGAARMSIRLLRATINWAIGEGLLSSNPCAHLNCKYRADPRQEPQKAAPSGKPPAQRPRSAAISGGARRTAWPLSPAGRSRVEALVRQVGSSPIVKQLNRRQRTVFLGTATAATGKMSSDETLVIRATSTGANDFVGEQGRQ